jgi:hypothetical protein
VRVRIYRPARSTMQAGLAATRHWVLEFPSETPRTPDPLMGWASASDTRTQARLRFASLAEAVKYADDHGWEVDVQDSRPSPRLAKNYAENFAWRRKTATGASDDLAKASDIARSIAAQYGMVPALGEVAYDRQGSQFLNAVSGRAGWSATLRRKPRAKSTARSADSSRARRSGPAAFSKAAAIC